MQYRVSELETPLRDGPSLQADDKRTLTQDTDLGEGVESEDHLWLKVGFGKSDDQKGFVLAAHCREKSGEPRREVPRGAVVETCVTTELRFNASNVIKPWYILADFLIARAIIETDVTNAGSKIKNSDAVGPLQISKREWDNFVQNGGNLVRYSKESDRQDPIRQVDAAAFRMHSDMKSISGLRTPGGQGASSDPFVPQLLDVFFAYLTNSPAAALAIRDAHEASANRSQPVTKFLRGPLNDDEVTSLHDARDNFFGTEANPKSLGDVVEETERKLNQALQKAFDDIKEFMPEAVPYVSVPEPGGGGTTFTEKAPQIMRKLIADFAFKDFQAAGILGNFGRETGGFRLFQERRPKSGRGGIGWAQWTGQRRVNYENFCGNNLDPRSDTANYEFLKHEMKNTPEKNVVPKLKETTSLAEATEVFMKGYERPGVEALPERITWAQRALNAFVGTSGTVTQKLREQIEANKIEFDSETLRTQLLGLNTGTKVTAKLQFLVLTLSQLAASRIRISSLVRSGTGSHHTEGRAVDIGNEEIAVALLPQVATNDQVAALEIDELIFDAAIANEGDRNKWNYDGGNKHNFNASTLDEHGNHMHFSVKDG